MGTVTRLKAERSRVRIPKKVVRDFSLFQNVQNGSDTHPASYSMVIKVLPGVKRS